MAKKKQSEISSEQKAQTIGVVVVIAIIITGIAIISTLLSSGNSDTGEQANQGKITRKWTKDDIEYKLASIEKGGLVEYTDKRIDEYASILDTAESKCIENRESISDLAVKGTQLLSDDGISSTPYELIQATIDSIPDEWGEPMNCTELMTLIVVRMGES